MHTYFCLSVFQRLVKGWNLMSDVVWILPAYELLCQWLMQILSTIRCKSVCIFDIGLNCIHNGNDSGWRLLL
jgi:hypothetical protein